MKTTVGYSVAITVLLACCSTVCFGQEQLLESEFQTLHSELAPKSEVWKTIPWHSDLLSAQRTAVEQKKPIFIWAMDGHPLGCT